MITYTVKRNGPEVEYLHDGEVIKDLTRIPPTVIGRLEESDSFRFDEQPDLPRCLWCEAAGTRNKQVYVNFILGKDAQYEQIPECQDHYLSQSLGKIVAELKRLAVIAPRPKVRKKRRPNGKKKRKIPEQIIFDPHAAE